MLCSLASLRCVSAIPGPRGAGDTNDWCINYKFFVSDKAFTSGLIIYGRNVTCSSDHEPGEFPSQTWTCKDMR